MHKHARTDRQAHSRNLKTEAGATTFQATLQLLARIVKLCGMLKVWEWEGKRGVGVEDDDSTDYDGSDEYVLRLSRPTHLEGLRIKEHERKRRGGEQSRRRLHWASESPVDMSK